MALVRNSRFAKGLSGEQIHLNDAGMELRDFRDVHAERPHRLQRRVNDDCLRGAKWWSHPNQQRLRTASPLTVMMPGTKPKPQPLQLGSTDWRSLRVATPRGFVSPDKNSLCDKLSPSDPIPTANRAGHSEWQFLPLVS